MLYSITSYHHGILFLFPTKAAAALLFSQMVTCGVNAEVQPFEMLQACLAIFTDLDQVQQAGFKAFFLLIMLIAFFFFQGK